MNICIDLTPLYDHLTGIERYNLNITKHLIQISKKDNFVLIFKNKIHEDFTEICRKENVRYIILPECNKLVFIQIRLYRALKKIKADYYLFLSFTSPILFRNRRIVNAIHDLTCWDCPESLTKKMVYYYRLTYYIACKYSWKIVTVSKFSQKRICDKYNLTHDRVPIIYDGLADVFKKIHNEESECLKKYHVPEEYILSVSTIEPRKNIQLLIEAYSELIQEGMYIPDLVLAGRKGWKVDEIVSNISEDTKGKIHFTGFIEDNDLPYLYYRSKVFVFPSKYEGFGLPIIEALSQGAVVVCSDAASLPEVAGSIGIIFESNCKEDLKKKILSSISISKTAEYVENAVALANKYNWEKEAEKLYELMRNDIKNV